MDGRTLLAWNLRKLRVERGVSQERLAYDSGVDRAYVSGIERAQENPSLEVLDRLAATLETPIAEFFLAPEEGAARPEALRRGRPPKVRE